MKKQAFARKRSKKWLLPLIAGIMAVLALIVVFFIPKGADEGSSTATAGEDKARTSSPAETAVAENNEGSSINVVD